MTKAIQTIVTQEEWYNAFIEECRAIIVEGEFNARWALVGCYHQLGKRILEELDKKYIASDIVQRVADSLGKKRRNVLYAVQFAKKYPDLAGLPRREGIYAIPLKTIEAPDSFDRTDKRIKSTRYFAPKVKRGRTD